MSLVLRKYMEKKTKKINIFLFSFWISAEIEQIILNFIILNTYFSSKNHRKVILML